MSYFMTDEQELLKQALTEFCQSSAAQAAIEADRAKGGFPRQSWDLQAKNGFIGMSIPEEYGGQGQNVVSELIVSEVLGDFGYPALEALAGHELGCAVLYYWGSEEISLRLLDGCCGLPGLDEAVAAIDQNELSLDVAGGIAREEEDRTVELAVMPHLA